MPVRRSGLATCVLALVLLATCVTIKPVAAAPNAVIQHDAGYVDISGSYHAVGEVKNTGNVWLQFVEISASFKDQNGVVVDIQPAFTYLVHLPPNASAGFDAVELNTTLSATIRSYTLTLTYQISQPMSAKLVIGKLTSSKDILGWLQIQGQVSNAGDSVSENTVITGIFYGKDGNVVYVGITSPTQSTIQPSTNQPFTLSVLDSTRVSLVSNYTLAAESLQYTSVS